MGVPFVPEGTAGAPCLGGGTMLQEGMPYSSGDWHVRSGSEDEFIKAWTEFIEWTVEQVPGARTFHLLRDGNDPRHFLSFGSWDAVEDFDAWRTREKFADLYGRCEALCDTVTSGPFTLAAGLRAPRS